jgi:hypothetical protein
MIECGVERSWIRYRSAALYGGDWVNIKHAVTGNTLGWRAGLLYHF